MGNNGIERRSTVTFFFGFDFWASANDPRPRLRHAIALEDRRTDPALGFASCRAAGTLFVHSSGLDPGRIISLRKPLPAPIRSWALGVLPGLGCADVHGSRNELPFAFAVTRDLTPSPAG